MAVKKRSEKARGTIAKWSDIGLRDRVRHRRLACGAKRVASATFESTSYMLEGRSDVGDICFCHAWFHKIGIYIRTHVS